MDGDKSKTAVQCKSLHSVLHLGSFVTLTTDEGKTRIAEVVGTGAEDGIRMRSYAPIEETPLRGEVPPVAEAFAHGIPELVRLDQVVDVDDSKITEIAYVFDPAKLQSEGLVLQGIKLVYVCRYDEHRNRISTNPIPETEPDEPRSLARTLYSDLEKTRDIIVQVLNRTAEHGDVAKTHDVFRCSDHFWQHLRRQFKDVVDVAVCETRKYRLRTTGQVKRVKSRFISKEHVLRLETKKHFAKYTDVFGSNMTFGSRRKKPRVSRKKPQPIRNCDTVNNILQGVEQYEEAEGANTNQGGTRKRKFTRVLPASRGGLDLVFNVCTGDFSIRIRYRKIRFDRMQTLDTEARPSTTAETNAGEEQTDNSTPPGEPNGIPQGALFDSDGEENTFEVLATEGDVVSARDNSSGIVVNFDPVYVRDAVRRKLLGGRGG